MKIMRIAGIVLIIIGLLIIVAAKLMNYSAERKSNEMVQAYISYAEHITEPAIEATTDAIEDKTLEAVTIPDGVMGVVIIDKIDLTAPLVEGTDNKSIMFALGHFKDTAMPGEVGNFAVAGHRSYTFGEYFNRLDELVVGDDVRVMYGTNTYRYVVDEISVVEPSRVEVLDSTENATITLVTCTPKWTATHRLIVKGHLAEEKNE